MTKCYFELRIQSARGTDSIAADCMRHLHSRQHLGKTLILCDNPHAMMAASRKQWLKLSRAIQKQRASTLNADKILKHTHTIAHMQHMRFSHKDPLHYPDADIYFLDSSFILPPSHCFSIYTHLPLDEASAKALLSQLPAETLIVDYCHATPWEEFGLRPKSILEKQVENQWKQARQFLASHNVDIKHLIDGNLHDIEAMDNALDTLLGVSHQFLCVANEFQRALELARPLKTSRTLRQEYDSLVLLAYRVQALSPGSFTQHFLQSYNEDDTFFLYDHSKRRFISMGETLAATIARHKAAGRMHLARALYLVFAV